MTEDDERKLKLALISDMDQMAMEIRDAIPDESVTTVMTMVETMCSDPADGFKRLAACSPETRESILMTLGTLAALGGLVAFKDGPRRRGPEDR